MPIQTTYPGVYVQEIPSGVRTITGVSTSDTAFVDFFSRGPIDRAVRITSFADFERRFGGLDPRSEASYAIQQYYLNGGSVAWVVRVASPAALATTRTFAAADATDTLTINAASPGVWGDALQIGIDHNTGDSTSFNLVVREVRQVNGRDAVVANEVYRNLSMTSTNTRYVVSVINEASQLIRVTDLAAGLLPAETSATPDVIAVVNDPGSTAFQPLPPADAADTAATAGNDGSEPGTTAWDTSDGANAILGQGASSLNNGINELDRIAPFVFNLLCLPGAARLEAADMWTVYAQAATFCENHRAFLILDIDEAVTTEENMRTWMGDAARPQTNYGAVYFPRLFIADPLNENRPRNVGASGTMAGIYARTDAGRGVWKAPAGTDATLRGATLAASLTDLENGALNPLGINAIRNFPIFGNVSWGARTLEGADQQASEWKYIPVRRTALFIEESLFQGLKWVVFEPNDEPLWSQIRLNVGAFMHNMFRQGAFQGSSPQEAYFVKCDSETTTQNDIDLGVVNIVVGFAPLKPAEFVILHIQQMAKQLEV